MSLMRQKRTREEGWCKCVGCMEDKEKKKNTQNGTKTKRSDRQASTAVDASVAASLGVTLIW